MAESGGWKKEFATKGALTSTAASLLRVHAHVFEVQGQMLIERAEQLREEASRIEHGGKLPQVPRVEEDEDERRLPKLEMFGASWDTGPWPGWAREWLEGVHETYLSHPEFAAVYNRVAAGRAPTTEVAIELVQAVRESRP